MNFSKGDSGAGASFVDLLDDRHISDSRTPLRANDDETLPPPEVYP